MRSCRMSIGFAPPPVYGFVNVTATGPPITVPLPPPPYEDEDSDAEDAWLLLFDDADMSDTLGFGPFTGFAEFDGDGPPPSKLRDAAAAVNLWCWLGAKMTGAGLFEEVANSSEAVSSELP